MGFALLASGDKGILYSGHEDGRLLFFEDLSRDGTNGADGSGGWSATSGKQIGQGWGSARLITGGGNGTLYVVREDGRLLFFQDLNRDGTNNPDGSTGWSGTSGNQIGQGWGSARLITSGGNGTLYVVDEDGRLLFFQDLNRDGTNNPDGSTGWSASSGNQ
ncbi:tachylectin-related carbohydrate-binding protein, partial [Streptomyces sp. NPDC047976]|uniref:tachylectin-related carbohydrate-binding protein n=1 Tax=Streptomyces sp. NPDC047976 TaxID=3155746 RepID=UPI0034332126